MRIFPAYKLVLLLTTLCLWSFYTASSFALSIEESRHLLSRTGFSPSFQEIDKLKNLTRVEAIDYQISTLKDSATLPLAKEHKIPYKRDINFKSASFEEKRQYRKRLRSNTRQLKEWWFKEMLTTNSPMTENLTLFWHNHFVSSSHKIRQPALMAQQNKLLRYHSSGNFGEFLKAILKDPAMIHYLDNHKNKKNRPNENLGRELLELFTLGEGNYSEDDIKNASLALTGNSYNNRTGEYKFRTKQHDSGYKTVFNSTGRYNSDSLVDLILLQKQTARYITEKLWNHYVTTPIPKQTLNQLSDTFYRDYELKPLIKNILTSQEFWHLENIGTKIKSPVRLVVGTYRFLNFEPEKINSLIPLTAQMGQHLMNPLSVKGWDTGNAWINSNSLLARQSALSKMTRGMRLKRLVDNKHSKQAWLNAMLAPSLQMQINDEQEHWKLVKSVINHINFQLE